MREIHLKVFNACVKASIKKIVPCKTFVRENHAKCVKLDRSAIMLIKPIHKTLCTRVSGI